MGIGINKGHVFTTYDVPLASSQDTKWEDNTWLVEHLRQLANTIERDKPKIHTIGIKSDAQYKVPILVIEFFENK